MHVSSVYQLRQALGLDPPGTPVKVVEPYQMLGEIAADLIGRPGRRRGRPGRAAKRSSASRTKDWKPWTLFDGTPVLVPEAFNTEPEPNGDILMYPEGDRSAPPSGRMPKGGFYFDTIVRQEPIDDETLSTSRTTCRSSARSPTPTLQHFAARPTGSCTRPTGRSWPTSAARPSATSPWCRRRG